MDGVKGHTGSVFCEEQMLPDNIRYLGNKQTIDVKLKEHVNTVLRVRQEEPFVSSWEEVWWRVSKRLCVWLRDWWVVWLSTRTEVQTTFLPAFVDVFGWRVLMSVLSLRTVTHLLQKNRAVMIPLFNSSTRFKSSIAFCRVKYCKWLIPWRIYRTH